MRVNDAGIDYAARWNALRRIGNSWVGRASIALPILGYLILFQEDIIRYLRLHASFCENCEVSWRLHLFYFGCCFFAVASLLYAFRCPPLINKYEGAPDFFEAEKNYFSNARNLNYLFHLIKREKGVPAFHPGNLLRHTNTETTAVEPGEMQFLAGLMGEHYVLQIRNDWFVRWTILAAYWIGFILISIPTIATFSQVLFQSLLRAIR